MVDYLLPGLTGNHVLKQIDHFIEVDPLILESGKFTNSIPVIMMSGADIPAKAYRQKYKYFDVVEHLQKSQLVEYITKVFLEEKPKFY